MPDDARKSIPDETDTIAALHDRSQRDVSTHQRAMERITEMLGRPLTLYLLMGAMAAWIVGNELARVPEDRPPFAWLQMALAVYAALVTTIVVVTQNRQGRDAQHRAYLDLQVNLLVERKTAKLVALIEELRRDLPDVRERHDPEAARMVKPLDAHAAADAIEEAMNEAAKR